MARRLFLCAAVSLLLFGADHLRLAAQSAAPQAATRLYDNFNTSYLDAAKWFGDQRGGGSALELGRRIVSGKLSLYHRNHGGTGSNVGDAGSENTLEMIQQPGQIREVRFSALVKNAIVSSACPAPGSSSNNAAVYFAAHLFNDGGDPVEGNVLAVVGLARSTEVTQPANTTNAIGAVFSATDGEIGFLDLGSVPFNTTVSLRMAWLPASNQIEFQLNANAPQVVSYTQDDTLLRDRRYFAAEAEAANCTSGRKGALIDALIDNVYVNP